MSLNCGYLYFFCYEPETGKYLACAPSYFDMQIFPLRSFCIVFYLLSFCREDRGVEESCAQLHSVQWWRQRRWQWDIGSPHLELFSQRRKPGAPAVQLGNGLHGDGHGLLHRVSVCGRQRRDLDLTYYMRAAAVLIHFRSPSGLRPVHK